MHLGDMAERAHNNSVAHGFWTNKQPEEYIPEKLCLIHSEVSEALEVYRDTDRNTDLMNKVWFRESDGKPEGFGPELADIVIRVGDLAHALNVDLDEEVGRKMSFNEGRPFKHGKRI